MGDSETAEDAFDAARDGQIERWIHRYLNAEGNNPALSEGLKRAPRAYFGPIHFPVALLHRCCGPEPSMKYPEPRESFERRVERIGAAIEAGHALPPLIVEYADDVLTLNDGNHRYEALLRSGADTCVVIIWTTGAADLRAFRQRFHGMYSPGA
ncbi:hypothetical protein [Niveibacterium sp. SC-1]|uniref:hypothetical protein n=1 Tax=Niveibacterium sp. SC-1 TaxID=3135646 RepID=UPI00311D71B4